MAHMQAQSVAQAAMVKGPAVASGATPSDLAAAKRLIAQVNAHHDIQTAFAKVPAPDPKAEAFWRGVLEAIGHFFETVGAVFAPLAPVLPYLLYLLAFVAIALLLSPVVRLFLTTRFTRLFTRRGKADDTPWRPSRAAVTALLSEIDALAERGEYDEAVHLLLVRSVADINNFRPDLVRNHYSARDILSHPLLPAAARPAFKAIVEWVEKSYFAGISVGKAGFDACRQAYVDFIRAEGIHPESPHAEAAS